VNGPPDRDGHADDRQHAHVPPDPGLALIYVEQGALTVSSAEPVVVVRGAALVTPGAQAQEPIPAETEFTLVPGDSFVNPWPSGRDFRNAETEDGVTLIALVSPVMTGTPTA
jgi:hypothetical protein